MLRRVLARELIMLRRGQQRLRRYASDVDARPAKRLVHLDANRAQAELSSADGRDVATRPTADDDDVSGSWIRSHDSLLDQSTSIVAGSSISSFTRTRKSTACWPSMIR